MVEKTPLINGGYLKSSTYFGNKKLESKHLPKYKYMLFQAMHSNLQEVDIYTRVGRLVFILPKGCTRIQNNCNARSKNMNG